MVRTLKPRSFLVLLLVRSTFASFTLPTTYGTNVVQTNQKGTWCYFPSAGQTRATSCGGDFSGVLGVHLDTTVSIGYYGPDNTRYGGPEWSVPVDNTGKVTLCVSGRAQDGTYQTACMLVTADNSLPGYGGCMAVIAQKTVTDGCYVPAQLAVQSSSTPPTPPAPTSPTTSPTTTSTFTSQVNSTAPNSSAASTSSTTIASSQTSGNSGLSTSDTIAVIFGVISTVAAVVGILVTCKCRQRKARERKFQMIRLDSH
jgi:hypothetical protein